MGSEHPLAMQYNSLWLPHYVSELERRRFAMALEAEARTYRREVERLLAEGHAGRHALIKGDEVISVWDTQRDALQAGREKFGLEDIAVVRIDERDPERFRLIDSRNASASCPA
jgi:hypothetical protein